MAHQRRTAPPLDPASLERLALRYVERYATTRGKLTAYLRRKLRERGWAEAAEPDLDGLVARFAECGYVDDRSFAEMRATAMTRRGLGARRVAEALRGAGIRELDLASARAVVEEGAVASALAFARRKRFGPYAPAPLNAPARQKAMAAFLRAGHGFDLARRLLDLPPGDLGEYAPEGDGDPSA
jgi:regulatory protein